MLDQYLSEQEHCLTENFVLLRKSIVPAKYDKPVFYLGEKNLLIFFVHDSLCQIKVTTILIWPE